MYPILFEFGPLKIYTYGFVVACAFIIGALLARLEAERQNLPSEKILDLAIYIAISGILGARLFYVLQNLQFYLRFPGQIWMLQRGGLSFYGGLILAAICAGIFLKKKGLPVFKSLDIVSPYLALAQAIGRIGCFLNGCCYGRYGHPVQIYSSLGLLLIFGTLRVFQDKGKKKKYFAGSVFLLYCSLYSLFRFFIEYLRGDNLRLFANLTIHQIVSAAIFLTSLIIWQKRWRNFS